MKASEAMDAVSKVLDVVKEDARRWESDVEEVALLLNNATTPPDVLKRARARADELTAVQKRIGGVASNLGGMLAALSTMPHDSIVELSAAEVSLLSFLAGKL